MDWEWTLQRTVALYCGCMNLALEYKLFKNNNGIIVYTCMYAKITYGLNALLNILESQTLPSPDCFWACTCSYSTSQRCWTGPPPLAARLWIKRYIGKCSKLSFYHPLWNYVRKTKLTVKIRMTKSTDSPHCSHIRMNYIHEPPISLVQMATWKSQFFIKCRPCWI